MAERGYGWEKLLSERFCPGFPDPPGNPGRFTLVPTMLVS
jgi:hypothetical protein